MKEINLRFTFSDQAVWDIAKSLGFKAEVFRMVGGNEGRVGTAVAGSTVDDALEFIRLHVARMGTGAVTCGNPATAGLVRCFADGETEVTFSNLGDKSPVTVEVNSTQ